MFKKYAIMLGVMIMPKQVNSINFAKNVYKPAIALGSGISSLLALEKYIDKNYKRDMLSRPDATPEQTRAIKSILLDGLPHSINPKLVDEVKFKITSQLHSSRCFRYHKDHIISLTDPYKDYHSWVYFHELGHYYNNDLEQLSTIPKLTAPALLTASIYSFLNKPTTRQALKTMPFLAINVMAIHYMIQKLNYFAELRADRFSADCLKKTNDLIGLQTAIKFFKHKSSYEKEYLSKKVNSYGLPDSILKNKTLYNNLFLILTGYPISNLRGTIYKKCLSELETNSLNFMYIVNPFVKTKKNT